MIRITSIGEPISSLSYMNAKSGGGTEISRLDISLASVGPLADELDAIICCSDLQGMLQGELLGVAVADHLAQLVEERVLPPAMRTGVILAGDLYSVPAANQRGGYGDVAIVWDAFAQHFAWIAGVAGNHDDMTNVGGDRIHVLDGEIVELDGFRIGGVGGIIGNARKPGRRDERDHLAQIASVVEDGCDILVLHEGPNGDDAQTGNPTIRELVTTPFTVCGHRHWATPLAEHEHGQILNVDARVVVLVR
ncbi:MAG: hypothetical protein QM831_36555 [Kofleriaceae bacterium]